jgi:acetate kinase
VNILCLNSGSSSLKFACYAYAGDEERRVLSGAIEALGSPHTQGWLKLKDDRRTSIASASGVRDTASAMGWVFGTLDDAGVRIDAVGHRVVFGGDRHTAPAIIDSNLFADLQRLSPFAPEHMPAELSGIAAALRAKTSIPHVACFDTAFHRRMPDVARRFPLPATYWDNGVRRYGFHGLSYEFIVSVLGPDSGRRLVVAHLGHGASMAAIRNGEPLETTMGLTPSGGLMMSTRSGDLDPGVILHLLREKHQDATTIERLLTHESGLLGVSGASGDMKALLQSRRSSPDADLAISMFCYHARKQIAALTAVLGGIDTLVFTGGIGERAAPVREEICRGLDYLGMTIDSPANDGNASIISTRTSACTVRVIETNENLMIARHTYQLTKGS